MAEDGSKKKPMAERLKDSYYNVFFSTTTSVNTLEENSITFRDLLCPSLGVLKCSLQLNFLVDVAWLLQQYDEMGQAKKPLSILYGKKINDDGTQSPNVTEKLVKIRTTYGTHHSKVGIYVYEDGSLRVVVFSANLIGDDWNKYCQGLWISPLCCKLPQDLERTSGESPTKFKSTLLGYLQKYQLPELTSFIGYVEEADFSAIRVLLVTSTPGFHKKTETPNHCHLFSVARILFEHCLLSPIEDIQLWHIIAQASSIGSLRDKPEYWLRGSFLRSLASHSQEQLKKYYNATLDVIYPTEENVLNSNLGAIGGHCLSYYPETKRKQEWLKQYLHCWKADNLSRSKTMPHIKTYCRVSPCGTKLAWFLLTSANISQAAWGGKIVKASCNVLSYEVGVMFLPKFFDQIHFNIKNDGKEGKVFPLIYDLPLTPYREEDEPWSRVVNF